MNISETTKILLDKALKQLKQAKIVNNKWSIGGGSILKYFYNHRNSNDIDIFFNDPQLITFVSPRINDANDDSLNNYSELSNFVKLIFEDGDVDFIFSKQITNLKPKKTLILGNEIFIDHPVEIIAKKIFYRSESISVRDLFDIAIVYKNERSLLMENISNLIDKINILNSKILKFSSKYNELLKGISRLEGSKTIDGNEIIICKNFFTECFCQYQNQSLSFHR